MSVPDEVRRLAEDRERARADRDFAAADALRDRIRAAGFEVTDTPEGPRVEAAVATAAAPRRVPPGEVVSLLDEPAAFDATLLWLIEGWPRDVRRGIESFDRHHPGMELQHVVVDVTSDAVAEWHEADVLPLQAGTGWGAARNAGLVRSLGELVVLVDGSVEATGHVLGPLGHALADPSVGVTGPFGIVTDDLREFHESPGPDVDAIEGYLMAVRRGQVRDGLRFDERFRFYRSADIELSFRVKDGGLRAVVTPVPVTRHEHRMWANTPADRRDALSKRNYYRFLERFRGRFDLTVAASRPADGG